MFNARPWRTGLLLTASLSAAVPAAAQVKVLRNADDQYIQGLREQGMSDLLDRFSEVEPPEDPIAKLALDVSLQDFVAKDLFDRAVAAGDLAMFAQSREAYEGVLAAQRQLIADHADDERIPIWQTDLAQMLLQIYLPRYYQNVAWTYEYGMPNAEQKAVYEAAMVEALQVTSAASNHLSLLPNRLGADAKLRTELEEMQIWFKIQDYTSIATPYWLSHAAHGVSLLPDDHAYFEAGNLAHGQKAAAGEEKERLRNRVVDECSAGLSQNSRTATDAKLLIGRTLVWSDDLDDIDDAIEFYLEEIAGQKAGTYEGYLATLARAVGRSNTDELNVSKTILGGMGSHQYVQSQLRNNWTDARLLAADLLFKLLLEDAQKAPAGERGAKIAAAYEQAYVELVDDANYPQFKQILFTRWADEADGSADPASLPGMVRLGIGEQLTGRGANLAQRLVQSLPQGADASGEVAEQIVQAQELLTRAMVFNKTLVGEDAEPGPVLARGLFNLATCEYWLAECAEALKPGPKGWKPFFTPAQTWLSVATRLPEAEVGESEIAEQGATIALNILFPMDHGQNSSGIRDAAVRAVYREAFELVTKHWGRSEAASNSRLYAGFQLYEHAGDLEGAAKVYEALPDSHKDFFQAQRQMIYAKQRNYRNQSDRLRVLRATEPPANAPAGADAQAFEAQKQAWGREFDRLTMTIVEQRAQVVEDAELIMLDAEEAAENADDPTRRFDAVTALGACRVVLAGMEAEDGQINDAMQMLEGFEAQYAADGPFAQLAALQANPESAAATLSGLVRSAQEQRILVLLDAKQTAEMAEQAGVMMEQSPDVAAAVINGVLDRIEALIEGEKRTLEAAALDVTQRNAQENIEFYANAAVDLGRLLEGWARQQGFDAKRMVAYQMPLADSLMLAGRGKEAIDIMEPILEVYPNSVDILNRTGRAHLAVYEESKQRPNYEGAMGRFRTVVEFYNVQPEKPAAFWEAWLGIFELLDAAGGEQAEQIPNRARILYGVDENLGGPVFEDRFKAIIDRNGGVERLRTQQ